MIDGERISAIIGYRFGDETLLEAAFTHSSYVNEHKAVSNERLEFLGDCVLNFLVGVKLYSDEADSAEGTLTARRAALVSRGPLSKIVDGLNLMQYLKTGAGVNKAAFSDKARSDLFEAILGAIYLDGGLEPCRRFLDRLYYPAVRPERDYKSELKIYAERAGFSAEYETTEENGTFVSRVTVDGTTYEGKGKTKRLSRIAAARAAVTRLDSLRKTAN